MTTKERDATGLRIGRYGVGGRAPAKDGVQVAKLEQLILVITSYRMAAQCHATG